MKVTIVVHGKFHAFHLAAELERRALLHRVISGYPRFRLRDSGVPKEKLTTLPAAQLVRHGLARTGRRVPPAVNWVLLNLFDIQASRCIDPTDIAVVWPDCAQRTIQAARSRGAWIVLEAGSTHMVYRQKLLEEEYQRFGARYAPVDARVLRSHLAEYGMADYIAVPSAFVRDSFLQMGTAPEKILQLPYGVDLSRFQPVPREDDTFRVLFCGGISLRKGVQYLIRAFSELDLPDARLWLVGSPEADIIPILRRHRDSRIVLKGRQNQDRLPWYYSQADVFCLPSIEDGFGMVIAEAMASGLPIICTTNTGGSELVQDGIEGFVVTIRDVEALKQRMLLLYKDRDRRRQMGRAAMARAKEATWAEYGTRCAEAYGQILNRAARGSADFSDGCPPATSGGRTTTGKAE